MAETAQNEGAVLEGAPLIIRSDPDSRFPDTQRIEMLHILQRNVSAAASQNGSFVAAFGSMQAHGYSNWYDEMHYFFLTPRVENEPYLWMNGRDGFQALEDIVEVFDDAESAAHKALYTKISLDDWAAIHLLRVVLDFKQHVVQLSPTYMIPFVHEDKAINRLHRIDPNKEIELCGFSAFQVGPSD